MAKEWARWFYDSPVWRGTRRAYKQHAHGLCEQCGDPGTIVHHRTPLTPANIHNTNIALSFSNLQLLCQACHNQIHMANPAAMAGMYFDAEGNLRKCARGGGENSDHPPRGG